MMAWGFSSVRAIVSGTTGTGSSGSFGASGNSSSGLALEIATYTGASTYTATNGYTLIQSAANSSTTPALKTAVTLSAPKSTSSSFGYGSGGSSYQTFGIEYSGFDPAFTGSALLDGTVVSFASSTAASMHQFTLPATTTDNTLLVIIVTTNNATSGVFDVGSNAYTDGFSSSLSTAAPSTTVLRCRQTGTFTGQSMAVFDAIIPTAQSGTTGSLWTDNDCQVLITCFALKGAAMSAGASGNMFLVF
jgi:hypothetical protein